MQTHHPLSYSKTLVFSIFTCMLAACSPGRSVVGYVTDINGGPVVNAEIALVEFWNFGLPRGNSGISPGYL